MKQIRVQFIDYERGTSQLIQPAINLGLEREDCQFRLIFEELIDFDNFEDDPESLKVISGKHWHMIGFPQTEGLIVATVGWPAAKDMAEQLGYMIINKFQPHHWARAVEMHVANAQ